MIEHVNLRDVRLEMNNNEESESQSFVGSIIPWLVGTIQMIISFVQSALLFSSLLHVPTLLLLRFFFRVSKTNDLNWLLQLSDWFTVDFIVKKDIGRAGIRTRATLVSVSDTDH